MLVSTPSRIRKLPDLELILLSGEFLHVSLVKRWWRRFGRRVRLVNPYGATEATMIQFSYEVQRADAESDSIPIRRPLPGEKVLLASEDAKRRSPGEVGRNFRNIITSNCIF
jgi:non-ribosomal peptide synthetase component F